jgi:hypothetical protein
MINSRHILNQDFQKKSLKKFLKSFKKKRKENLKKLD